MLTKDATSEERIKERRRNKFLNIVTYHSSMSDSSEQENFEFMLNHKKCVLHFVQEWAVIVGNAFREDHTINAFLEVRFRSGSP